MNKKENTNTQHPNWFDLGDVKASNVIDVDTLDPLGNVENSDEVGDPDNNWFQGDLRYVKDAKLVYKIKNSTGTFDELWAYNDGRIDNRILQNILAGTDILLGQTDGTHDNQYYDVWKAGGVVMVKIFNIPN
jgi:hypothetical protein